ncbi:MAG: DEAD/DEAH box helicase [Treponema sp.]|nr:DEAD/DEAH box helicase [Treponema sp.]
MSNNFEQLGITPCFVKRLEERLIKDPTDIQNKIIPLLLNGDSVFFTSATGTGKTFAYLLPLLSLIQEDSQGIKLLVLAPTLELCTQINSELEYLLEGTELKSVLLIGSVNIERQIENLKNTKPDIIIGSPNRLLILARKKIIRLNNLKSLVLDEADRLVSDEMIDDTTELLNLIMRYSKNNKDFVIGACSATINIKNKDKLLSALNLNNAALSKLSFIESEDNEILRDKIEHWAIFSEKRKKDQTLRSFLSAVQNTPKKKKVAVKVLIFTSRGDEAAFVLSRLQYHHINAVGLFGKAGKRALSANDRKAALDDFRSGEKNVLVSTDLAARGLDITGVTHVISLDVPQDSEVYIHRCGRTARAGRRGVMVTIGDETQMRLLAAMEKKLRIKIFPKELHYGQVTAPLL